MRKKFLLDNLVHVSPRRKEPIRQFHIEPLPMNDLQKVIRDKPKPEQILQPRNHIQQVALTDRDGLAMAYKSKMI